MASAESRRKAGAAGCRERRAVRELPEGFLGSSDPGNKPQLKICLLQ